MAILFLIIFIVFFSRLSDGEKLFGILGILGVTNQYDANRQNRRPSWERNEK
jgi:hypothetical protein